MLSRRQKRVSACVKELPAQGGENIMKKILILILFLFLFFQISCQAEDSENQEGLRLCPWPCLDPCYQFQCGSIADDEICHYEENTNVCTTYHYQYNQDETCCTTGEIDEEFELLQIHDGKQVYWIQY